METSTRRPRTRLLHSVRDDIACQESSTEGDGGPLAFQLVEEQEVELEGGPHNGGMAQAKLDQGEVAIGSPRGPLYRRTDRQTTDGKPIFAYAPARTALNKLRIDRSRRTRWPGGPDVP